MKNFQSYKIESYLRYIDNMKINRKIDEIHIHHTKKPSKKSYDICEDKEKAIYSMYKYHMTVFNWKDIGQHATISPDGLVWSGRSIDVMPASIKNHNARAFAIELYGDFDIGKDVLGGEQLRSTRLLIRSLFKKFNTNKLVFHRDHSNKTCPGSGITKTLLIGENTIDRGCILGESKLHPLQMKKYTLDINPNPKINTSIDNLIQKYIEEGELEGVRGDLAYAQALYETGFFTFRNLVRPIQNNYACLKSNMRGAYGDMASFPSPATGVRAHIQHLKGYASRDKLKTKMVDYDYINLVEDNLLGTVKTIKDLNDLWFIKRWDYGDGIIKIYKKIQRYEYNVDLKYKLESSIEKNIKLNEVNKDLQLKVEDLQVSIDIFKKSRNNNNEVN